MSLFKPLKSRHLNILFKPSFSLSQNLFTTQSNPTNKQTRKPEKPLHILFTEAVGLTSKPHQPDNDTDETNELKKSLIKLEQQVKKLNEIKNKDDNPVDETERQKKGTKKKPERLYNLFAENKDNNNNGKTIRDLEEDPSVYRELSGDMAIFVKYLYDEGYFRDANFVKGDNFDVSVFSSSYARMFIQSVAEKFGKDKQDIAKCEKVHLNLPTDQLREGKDPFSLRVSSVNICRWVSASDLRKVALFGCPSLGKRNIFTAKKLRTFFKIHEPTVCSKCTLKASCKFPNQGAWKHDTNNLDLGVVMKVITLYALESTHPQLVVTQEIKDAVNNLLKEILNLSRNSA